MKKELLEKLVQEGLSNIEIAEKLQIHRTTVAKQLLKFGIVRQAAIHTHCDVCGNVILNNVHNRSKCPSCVTRIRRYRLKKRSVEYKGGKCIKCGYNENISALTFHHRDQGKKEFGIGTCMHKSWLYIKTELDKCDLLCSNCHNIEHSKYDDELFLKFADEYQLK